MKKIIIAAVSTEGIIATNGQIPWYLPEDLKHFKETTVNNILLVGYNTYLTLPSIAFKNRKYIVVDRNSDENINENIFRAKTVGEGINLAESLGYEKLYIIGGEKIYNETIEIADECIITWVDMKFEDDKDCKYFPIEELHDLYIRTNLYNWKESISGIDYSINYHAKII